MHILKGKGVKLLNKSKLGELKNGKGTIQLCGYAILRKIRFGNSRTAELQNKPSDYSLTGGRGRMAVQ